VDNLLIGGKSMAASHIVNAATRVHYGEWVVGSAAGTTAGWLMTQQPDLTAAMIVPKQKVADLQMYLEDHGARIDW
jgi:FAD dependent oxidoreductase